MNKWSEACGRRLVAQLVEEWVWVTVATGVLAVEYLGGCRSVMAWKGRWRMENMPPPVYAASRLLLLPVTAPDAVPGIVGGLLFSGRYEGG